VTLATPTFEKILRVHVRLSLETRLSNLKTVVLTLLELLAFNAHKFKGSRDPGHAPFAKIFKGSCSDSLCKHAVKFEVRSFNRFGTISI